MYEHIYKRVYKVDPPGGIYVYKNAVHIHALLHTNESCKELREYDWTLMTGIR